MYILRQKLPCSVSGRKWKGDIQTNVDTAQKIKYQNNKKEETTSLKRGTLMHVRSRKNTEIDSENFLNTMNKKGKDLHEALLLDDDSKDKPEIIVGCKTISLVLLFGFILGALMPLAFVHHTFPDKIRAAHDLLKRRFELEKLDSQAERDKLAPKKTSGSTFSKNLARRYYGICGNKGVSYLEPLEDSSNEYYLKTDDLASFLKKDFYN